MISNSIAACSFRVIVSQTSSMLHMQMLIASTLSLLCARCLPDSTPATSMGPDLVDVGNVYVSMHVYLYGHTIQICVLCMHAYIYIHIYKYVVCGIRTYALCV